MPTQEPELLSAVKRNDLGAVRDILLNKPGQISVPANYPCLHEAISNRNAYMFWLLLANNANLEYINEEQQDIASYIAAQKAEDMLLKMKRTVIKENLFSNQIAKDALMHLLLLATPHNSDKFIKNILSLLPKDYDIKHRLIKTGDTCYTAAVKRNNAKILDIFLKHTWSNLWLKTLDKKSPLLLAIELKREDCIQKLCHYLPKGPVFVSDNLYDELKLAQDLGLHRLVTKLREIIRLNDQLLSKTLIKATSEDDIKIVGSLIRETDDPALFNGALALALDNAQWNIINLFLSTIDFNHASKKVLLDYISKAVIAQQNEFAIKWLIKYKQRQISSEFDLALIAGDAIQTNNLAIFLFIMKKLALKSNFARDTFDGRLVKPLIEVAAEGKHWTAVLLSLEGSGEINAKTYYKILKLAMSANETEIVFILITLINNKNLNNFKKNIKLSDFPNLNPTLYDLFKKLSDSTTYEDIKKVFKETKKSLSRPNKGLALIHRLCSLSPQEACFMPEEVFHIIKEKVLGEHYLEHLSYLERVEDFKRDVKDATCWENTIDNLKTLEEFKWPIPFKALIILAYFKMLKAQWPDSDNSKALELKGLMEMKVYADKRDISEEALQEELKDFNYISLNPSATGNQEVSTSGGDYTDQSTSGYNYDEEENTSSSEREPDRKFAHRKELPLSNIQATLFSSVTLSCTSTDELITKSAKAKL